MKTSNSKIKRNYYAFATGNCEIYANICMLFLLLLQMTMQMSFAFDTTTAVRMVGYFWYLISVCFYNKKKK